MHPAAPTWLALATRPAAGRDRGLGGWTGQVQHTHCTCRAPAADTGSNGEVGDSTWTAAPFKFTMLGPRPGPEPLPSSVDRIPGLVDGCSFGPEGAPPRLGLVMAPATACCPEASPQAMQTAPLYQVFT